MYLKSLRLHNFRLLQQVEIEFSSSINLICGDNAQGKSSLLEAIYLLSTGQSFRGASFKEMLKKKESGFFIEGVFVTETGTQKIRITFDGKEKRFYDEEESYPSFSKLLSIFPLTLYSPEDVELISGTPAFRRRALNIHLAKADPIYLYHLYRYAKALQHRNALLKERNNRGIEIFEEQLAQSGAYLTDARFSFCLNINPILQKYYSHIVDEKEMPILSYKEPSYLSAKKEQTYQNLVSAFSSNREKEKDMSYTLIGPHRDDFSFAVDEMHAKSFASEGQKRSLASAYRMAEWEFRKKNTSNPAFAIDDFGSHLDESRKRKIEELLPSLGQVFLTAPEKDVLSSLPSCIFKVNQGKIYSLSKLSI